jgi:hypothetical protein
VTRASRVAAEVAERVPVIRRPVCGWMCMAAAAQAVAGSPDIMQAIASNHILGLGALIGGLGLVLYLSALIHKTTDSRMQPVGPLRDVFRGLPPKDVRGQARDVRGARGVRLDSTVEFWPGP